MTANREVLHQIVWAALAAFKLAGSRQGRVGRRCSRAFEKVGLDSDFRTGIGKFRERGRRKHRVDATNNDKLTNGPGERRSVHWAKPREDSRLVETVI